MSASSAAGTPDGERGGVAGMPGANGGPVGTTGGLAEAWRAHRLFLLGLWAVSAVIAVVNSLSTIEDRAGRVRSWEPWTWELTSFALIVPLAAAIGAVTLRLRATGLPRPAAIACHAVASLGVSLAHVAGMVALRRLVYAAMGERYLAGLDLHTLGYEYRKDALTYVLIAIGFATWDRVRRPAPVAVPLAAARPAEVRLTVRDGSRTHLLAPAEIAWAQAAGNYVELMTSRGPVLHRTSLAALESELVPHGFARIHRSRLVRLAAVRSLAPTAAGDFELALEDGTKIGGSRRFRAALADYTKL